MRKSVCQFFLIPLVLLMGVVESSADSRFEQKADGEDHPWRFPMCRNSASKKSLKMRRRRRRRGRVRERKRQRGDRVERSGEKTIGGSDQAAQLEQDNQSTDATEIGPRSIENLTIGIRDTYIDAHGTAPPMTLSWISVHPKDPDVAYLGTVNGFLYRTSDGGKYWHETRLLVSQTKFFGAIRQGGAQLGVGIKGAAKRLQAQIRSYWKQKTKAWEDYPYAYPYAVRGTSIGVMKSPLNITPGSINMKQYMVMRSGSMSRIPIRINHIGFDPNNPKVAFAATAYGVYKTKDGGISWDSVFFGGTRNERDTIWVVVHPKNSDKVFLGTLGGLFISDDGGMTWDKDFRTPLGGARVLKISFFTKNPDIIYAGTDGGVWKSTDGGKNWVWVYGLKESGIKEAFVIERIAVSNVNPDLVYIGTQDGLLKTTDGGKTWKKLHEGLFSRRFVRGLRISPLNDKHIYLAVEKDLYESLDGGESWRILYVPVGQWWINEITYSEKSPSDLWVLTDRIIMRLSPLKENGLLPGEKSEDELRTAGEGGSNDALKIPELPPVGRIMDNAFRHAHVHQSQLKEKRKRAFIRNLIPQVEVSYLYNSDAFARNFRFAKWRETPMDPWLYETFLSQNHIFTVMFTWDLAKLFYDADALQFGRVAVQARWVRRNIRSKILWLYDEGSRLRELMVNSPPKDDLLKITYRNRLKEIYMLLSIQTGNFVSSWQDD